MKKGLFILLSITLIQLSTLIITEIKASQVEEVKKPIDEFKIAILNWVKNYYSKIENRDAEGRVVNITGLVKYCIERKLEVAKLLAERKDDKDVIRRFFGKDITFFDIKKYANDACTSNLLSKEAKEALRIMQETVDKNFEAAIKFLNNPYLNPAEYWVMAYSMILETIR